jgi:glutamyl-tRNA synthetase
LPTPPAYSTVHSLKMTTLQLPLSHTPPYALLSLALFKNSQVQWQEATELPEPTYGDVKGVEAVRAELEKGLPGKEVCTMFSFQIT